MKIGDQVRFLSEVGGGKVAGFKGKDIVLVEDEDGFQIPTHISDVVVVENDNYDIANVHSAVPSAKQFVKTPVPEPADLPVTFRAPVEERKGGDKLSVYLAFVPVDIHSMTNTTFEAYFVNDSNYYVRYVCLTADGSNYQLKSTAEVEPNTKAFIEEFDKTALNGLERLSVQVIAYKRDKAFMFKEPVSVQLRIDTVKFYKLHTFLENDFFEEPALIYTIVENDVPVRPLVIDSKQLKEQMYRKAEDDCKTAIHESVNKKDKNAPIVIDLHAGELLDTTAGMSGADIHQHQMDVFHKTLAQYAQKKGTKIIFIHGKGDGILRQSIIHQLKYRYKSYTYQDASFQEYGYGATQITIK
jgi:hypothetical protein